MAGVSTSTWHHRAAVCGEYANGVAIHDAANAARRAGALLTAQGMM
jgi:hypothetical protein